MKKSKIITLKEIAVVIAAMFIFVALLFLADVALQSRYVEDYKRHATYLEITGRAPTCDVILAYDDPLKRHIYAEIICEGKNPNTIPGSISDEEADKLTPRYP